MDIINSVMKINECIFEIMKVNKEIYVMRWFKEKGYSNANNKNNERYIIK